MSDARYIFVVNNSATESADLANSSCPVNEFCSSAARSICVDTTLVNCSQCSSNAAYGYAIAVVILGIAILCGNVLILLVFINRYRKGTVQKIDPIKMSLAMADVLTGIQIFVVVLPNIVWKINATMNENRIHRLDSRKHDSPECGAMLILTFSASLYHLIFLAGQRLFALLRPYSYKGNSLKRVYIILLLVWTMAGVTAALPGFLPQYYRYCSKSNLCFVCSSSWTAHLVLYSVFLFLPFSVMTFTSIATGVVARQKLMLSTSVHGDCISKERALRFTKRQFAVFKTVLMMQFGFTVTLGPTLVCLALVFVGLFECDVAEVLESMCFTLYFTNSLVNVIVYSVREKSFRSDVASLCSCFKKKRQRSSPDESPIPMQEQKPRKQITKNSSSPALSTQVNRSILVEFTNFDQKLPANQ